MMRRADRTRRRGFEPRIETFEPRWLPSGIVFQSGFGIGASGISPAIHANAVATDASGDTYVTGSFRGTANFDPSGQAAAITTAGTQDTFVAKYSPAGALVWARRFAGSSSTVTINGGQYTTYAVGQGSALAVDSGGNVFVTGSFNGAVNFNTSGGTQTLISPSQNDVFAAKLDPSGNLVWASAAPGTQYDDDEAYALALDGAGGVIIGGSFQDSASFGATNLTASGSFDAFVARLGPTGAFTWAVDTQGHAGSTAEVHGLAVDGSGNIGVAGFLAGTVNFSPGGSSPTNLTSAGSDDVAIWRLGPTGQLLWAHSFGGTGYDAATAIAVDTGGNFYATGGFSGTVNFGTGGGAANLSAGAGANYDAFVLKLDPSGNEVWADGLVGPGGSAKGQGIVVDPQGLVDVAGTFSGLVDFDPGPGTDNLTSGGSSDVFLGGFSPAGSLVYALQAGTTNFNAALGVAVNPAGIVAIAGTYTGPISFGASTIPAIGQANIFAARAITEALSPPPAPVIQPASNTGGNPSSPDTSITKPVFNVVASDPTYTVELRRNGVVVASRQGSGAVQDPGVPSDGVYSYTVDQLISGGSPSAASPAQLVTIDTHPPAAPPTPTLLLADDSSGGLGITNKNDPRLVGTAEPSSNVQILNASGTVVGTGQASSIDGSYTIAPTTPLADGTYAFRARAIDLAGNVGVASGSLSITIKTSVPSALSPPTLLAADVTISQTSATTSVKRPRLSGTATPGDQVQLLDGSGNILGTATASSPGGAYTVQANLAFPNGATSVRVRQVDPANNLGPASSPLVVTIRASAVDYFGQGIADPATFHPATATFTVRNTVTGGVATYQWGVAGDVPVSGDFFGTGKTNVAIYRPSTSTFFIFNPVTVSYVALQVGQAGDIPVPGDYDGDGKTDAAVFRPSTATFIILDSSTNTIVTKQWGAPGDVPVPADYDGIGRVEEAVFRPSNATWYIFNPTNGSTRTKQWGAPGDEPIPADFDGDGKTDIAVFRPVNGYFYAIYSSTQQILVQQWGVSTDLPIPADYTGDGKADVAIYRPFNSTIYILNLVNSAILIYPTGTAAVDEPVLDPVTSGSNNGNAIRAIGRGVTGGGGGGFSPSLVWIPLPGDAPSSATSEDAVANNVIHHQGKSTKFRTQFWATPGRFPSRNGGLVI
jgi:hypothetical protein